MSDRSRKPLLVLYLIIAMASLFVTAEADDLESRVKAAFVERFTRFIEWPDDSLDSTDVFVIGVIGRTGITPHLREILSGRKIKNRDVQIRVLGAASALEKCHVLFIASSERSNLNAILYRTKNHPVLTIGDSHGFAERGVLVNLYKDGSFVRFEINMNKVRSCPLKFSAKLLTLSKKVADTEN